MQNPLLLSKEEILLRIALAFSFIYPAINALFDPYAWIGYFPGFILDLASGNPELLLHSWGVFEVALALWVLFGKKIFIPSVVMTLALIAVVALNPGQFPILFRDVSIALAAAALAWMHRPKNLHGTA